MPAAIAQIVSNSGRIPPAEPLDTIDPIIIQPLLCNPPETLDSRFESRQHSHMVEGTVKRGWARFTTGCLVATATLSAHCGSQVTPDADRDAEVEVLDVGRVPDVASDTTTFDTVDRADVADVSDGDVAPADAPPPDACSNGTTIDRCGPTCAPCPSPANATPSCDRGRCAFTCLSGFGDCDLREDNGCESSIESLERCGACSARCDVPVGATGACRSGRCEWSCNAGFERVMDRCERIPVRPILPQSTTYIATSVPTFEWTDPGGVDEFEVVLGQNRAAIATASGVRVPGARTLRWPTELSNENTWFWQVRAYAMGREVSRSAIWAFRPTYRGVRSPSDNLLRLLVDVDCDGEEDIAIGERTSAADSGVYFYDHRDLAMGTYRRSSRMVPLSLTGSLAPLVFPLGDIDGNGCSDLYANGLLLLGRPGMLPTVVARPAGIPMDFFVGRTVLGDIDRDGYADLGNCFRNGSSTSYVAFGASGGFRTILPLIAPGMTTPAHPQLDLPVDRDLDGIFETALVDRADATNQGRYRWDSASSTFARVGPLGSIASAGSSWISPVGDISCDGSVDYVSQTGDLLLGTRGPPLPSGQFRVDPAFDSSTIAFPRGFIDLGDINRDGCDDLAMLWYRRQPTGAYDAALHFHLGSNTPSQLLVSSYSTVLPGVELTGAGPGGWYRARMKQWNSLGGPLVVLAHGGATARVYRIPLTAPSSGTLDPIYTIPTVPGITPPEFFALLPNSLVTPLTPLSRPWLDRRRSRFELLFSRG